MHCRKHQGVNRVVEEIVLSLIRLGIVSFYNFKTPIFIGDDENDNDNNPTKIMHESGVMAGLVAVYADDLAEKVKKRVATLTRQARRM